METFNGSFINLTRDDDDGNKKSREAIKVKKVLFLFGTNQYFVSSISCSCLPIINYLN